MVLHSFDRNELVDFRMGLTPWCALYMVQIGLFKMDKNQIGLFVLAFYFIHFLKNWMIIALQSSVGFCCTVM